MNVFSLLKLLSGTGAIKLENEDVQKLLKDENKNGIPDFLEKGMAPEDLGINLGQKRTEGQIQKSRDVAKSIGTKMGKASMPDLAQKILNDPHSNVPVEKDGGRVFLMVGLIIFVIVMYFFFR